MRGPIRPNHVQPALLSRLVAGLAPTPKQDPWVSGITLDSRDVAPGWLYVGLPGSRAHGASFASSAQRSGAAAVITDAAGAELVGDIGIPTVVLPELRRGMGVIAARLFGEPAKKLTTFGLTGTNGKTTTAFLLAAALGGEGVATIGTNGFRLSDAELDATRTTVTTPESPDLQALLAVMCERGATSAAIEVSSHALVLERVAGMVFDYAGFINLGNDHLDFHGTPEAYLEAKASLFTPGHCRTAVINLADNAGRKIADRVRNWGRPGLVTVGTPDADYHLTDFADLDPLHTCATIHAPSGSHRLAMAMPGRYNAQNALLAFALAEQAGRPAAEILAGLATAHVPGRMQPVELGSAAPLVVVDFAHTPQAVAAALASFEPYRPTRRVIVVLGAGGDRDPSKRREMGAAAGAGADVVVVTDDNPRTEDPASIRSAVAAGVRSDVEIRNVAGRAAAIREALAEAGPGDVVAILGKGHEQGQIVGDSVIEFDDVAVARSQWAALEREG